MHAQKPAALRCVVIVADGERVTAWQAQCLNRMRAISQVDIVGVLVMRGKWHTPRGVTNLLSYVYERWVRRRGRSLRRGQLSAVLPGVPIVGVVPVVGVVEADGVDLPVRQIVQQMKPDILLNLTEHRLTMEANGLATESAVSTAPATESAASTAIPASGLATYGVWFFRFGEHATAGRLVGVPGWWRWPRHSR